MSDLEILDKLAKAETEARMRLERAERKAEAIVRQAREDAENIVKEGHTEVSRMREREFERIRKDVARDKSAKFQEGVDELDRIHPVENPSREKAAKWLVESFENWIVNEGGRGNC